MAITCDVAVIGGGPAASTLGTLLRKYNPKLSVSLFEREVFPRQHVGESMLPQLIPVLAEMDVWDKVEAAGFPVKVGSLFKWGTSPELWPLTFIGGDFDDPPRPAKFEGQRVDTAFQIDRSIFDEILLDHAKELGCDVYEGVKVASVEHCGDQINGFELAATDAIGETALGEETQVQARWYVDASGNSGFLRRAMGVEVDSPTSLRNVAIYDYWQNAGWYERIGGSGTRTLVLSIDYGWLWFIQVGTARTSVGLVVPAEYVKKSGKRPEQLYTEALANEPTISRLLAESTRENILQTTRDWSFVSDRLVGKNWFLAGDAAGFADPILSAGLTLAQTGSRNLAYTILELNRGKEDPDWLKSSYEEIQAERIRNHIRFCDYWYSANGAFSELKEYCSEIAATAGISLEPEAAFQWMGRGGFANDGMEFPAFGGKSVEAVKQAITAMGGTPVRWEVEKYNRLYLHSSGAKKGFAPAYSDGRVSKIPCMRRGPSVLAATGVFLPMTGCLDGETDLEKIMLRFANLIRTKFGTMSFEAIFRTGIQTLEAMLAEGWIKGSVNPAGRRLGVINQPGDLRMGWIKDGVGLLSTNPASANQVVVPWDEFEQLRGV